MGKKTIIAGTRSITDPETLKEALDQIDWEIDEVVSGTQKGVDRLGEAYAESEYLPVKKFEPDWDQHGKAAGPIRNREMANYADALLAVWNGQSPGTRSMIETAQEEDLDRIYVYRTDIDHTP